LTNWLYRSALLFGAFLGLAVPLGAATFTVTTDARVGPGSLNQAILDANANPGPDTIVFAIPGDGVHVIDIANDLPEILHPVVIDGYTQPGASPNTNPPGQGFNTVLKIEIRGQMGTDYPPCLTYRSPGEHTQGAGIRGLAINGCPQNLFVWQADHVSIDGNFIGTDASGTVVQPPGNFSGIEIRSSSSVDVTSNLVAGNTYGIDLDGATFTTVTGNLVGTDVGGSIPLQNSFGIRLVDGDGNSGNVTIGGTTPAERNVISGNAQGISAACGNSGVCAPIRILGNFVGTDVTGTKPLGNANGMFVGAGVVEVTGNIIADGSIGLEIDACDALIAVHGNFIGTDATATRELGNRLHGILVDPTGIAVIGSITPGEGNVVAHNGHALGPTGAPAREEPSGILVFAPAIAIRGNRIFDNRSLGIDLFPEGVTLNDPGDGDVGANGMTLQNFPIITSVVPGTTTTHIEGSLNSMPSQFFAIDLYASAACPRHPNDLLQGETYLGTVPVNTDGSGNVTFTTDVPVVLAAGQPVTATATDAQTNTSEFSQRIVLSVDPPSGPAGVGAGATISGMLFEPGAAVTVGGVPASDVVLVDAQTITATMPALAPGTVHDVTVALPSGLDGALAYGWLADFLDVPASQLFHDFVVRLVRSGVATGVGGGNYGVDQPTLRQQMAVFLLKAEHGGCYAPPPCTGVFADVPCPSPFADWIEELAAEGISAGCGGGDYCPQAPVRRDQMAAFLLKAEYGATYVPPSCTGIFSDVLCPSTFADWIEELAAEQITGGCGGGDYCPLNATTRGQMATFVTKTLSIP
jgi:parallel beta-helix repeat protein